MSTESTWSLYWNPPIHTSMLEGQEAVLSCNNPDLGSLLNGTNLTNVFAVTVDSLQIKIQSQ